MPHPQHHASPSIFHLSVLVDQDAARGRHVSEFLTKLFSSQDFMPHGDCYLWKPEIVWLHAISDGVIALSYYLIPFVLIYFVRKRKDLPFNAIFVMFGVFTFACGTTHLMEVWALWHPFYRLSGVIKAFTAVASVGTAVMLVQFVPRALALPSPPQLRTANAQFENEIKDRRRVEQALHHAYDELEVRVQERTADLASANAALRNEIVERQYAQEACETAQSELAHVPGMDGLELQRQLASASHPTPIISLPRSAMRPRARARPARRGCLLSLEALQRGDAARRGAIRN